MEAATFTPQDAQAAVADAFETAAMETLPLYEPETSSLEDQLSKLAETEADLRARKSRLQTEKSELARQRAEAMRIGDADKAAALGREIADLESEIATIEETLAALADTRRELTNLIQERDAVIRQRARELLTDTLARAADGVDTKLRELASRLDALALLWREVRPGGENWAAWQSRLGAHIWDGIAQHAVTDEVSEFARQRKPWLLNFDAGRPLAARLGLDLDKVLTS